MSGYHILVADLDIGKPGVLSGKLLYGRISCRMKRSAGHKKAEPASMIRKVAGSVGALDDQYCIRRFQNSVLRLAVGVHYEYESFLELTDSVSLA